MSHHTLEAPFRWAADPIKGSRFLGVLVPVADEGAAGEALDAVREEFAGASHHCWALRLGDGTERSDDDGEPGGSAGRPILAQLAGHEVLDVLVVVVRWFGGTKLGVGGLIRAYGGTAGKALDAAPLIRVEPMATVRLTYGYEDTNAVDAVLAGVEHVALEASFGARVSRSVQVRVDRVDDLVARMTERSGGRVALDLDQPGTG